MPLLEEPSNGCARYCYWEFHYSRFWLGYRDWKPFAFSPWLPKHINYQCIYLVFRWAMAAYFAAWLVPSGLHELNGGVKYFIFLTNWCYLLWNTHLIISAVSVTVKVSQVYCSCSQRRSTNPSLLVDIPKPYIDIDRPVGCCGRDSDDTTWYQKLQWLVFYLGAEMAVTVSILYWAAIYNDNQALDGVNLNTHLINGIIALFDICFSGVPVRILHFIYPVILGCIYAVFSGIYFAADGTNVQGDPYIYRVLDYGNEPGTAAGWVVAVIVVLIPIVHLLLFGLYTIRFWLTYFLWARREPANDNAGDIVELK